MIQRTAEEGGRTSTQILKTQHITIKTEQNLMEKDVTGSGNIKTMQTANGKHSTQKQEQANVHSRGNGNRKQRLAINTRLHSGTTLLRENGEGEEHKKSKKKNQVIQPTPCLP